MDTLNADNLFDASWLPDALPEIPDLSPEDAAMVERFVAYAVARKNAQPKRKKEDPINSPSEKISIRITGYSATSIHCCLFVRPHNTPDLHLSTR